MTPAQWARVLQAGADSLPAYLPPGVRVTAVTLLDAMAAECRQLTTEEAQS
jgi:hypothetical protein